jgi:NADPH-dependent glutamate synthase beta subunit-like oxidoreductase/coenzyme F420-reducing hydrogenase delta subunit/Pyruvate/2-oxoacid:ferredoxin oxidoreductase delta subunit
VQAYIALIAQRKFKEALDVIRKSIPLPLVCGRVCFSPCEDACVRKDFDEAVSIRALKRLAADYELKTGKTEKPKPIPKTCSEKVAIVGSGPAGLTAAYELVKKGYPVTVFERTMKPGGALRYCIPAYRLPKDIVEEEIGYITALGVEFKTGTIVGKDVTIEALFQQGYKALFIGTGAHRCLSLNIEGEELKGVMHSLTFLNDINYGKPVKLGNRVIVIGGGNVAVDAARTAKRLGPEEVTVFYRRTEQEMPAHKKEVEEAKLEGVKFQFLTSPKKIVGKDGKVAGIECIKMRLGEPDESGRRRPVPVEGSEFTVTADNVILAIGEKPDTSFLPKEIQVTKGNTIVVDQVTLQTTVLNIFAGGDAVTGPASVIEAITAGKKAAESIDRYLRGLDLKAGREKETYEIKWATPEKPLEKKPRQPMPRLEPLQRARNFNEVELGFSPKTGIQEAHRCLSCGPCAQCLEMEELCEPDDAVVDENRCIACANCEKICEYGAIKVEKSVAKVNLQVCKGCGTCVIECPAVAISMKNCDNETLLAAMKEAATEWKKSGSKPNILAFVCNRVSKEGGSQVKPPHIVSVPCSGRVDPLHVLQAFMMGADGVLIVGCETSDCHYVFGASAAEKRVRQMKGWLEALGMASERLQIEHATANGDKNLNEILRNFETCLEKMEPNPLHSHSK